jgi:O-methyltransferase
MNLHGCKKDLHLYDSFKGLPKATRKDRGAIAGKGAFGVGKWMVIRTFKRFDLKIPKIHAGWFQDTLPDQLPEKICFAFLDGDFYQSIKDSLIHVYPRLTPGAIALIDDYNLRRRRDNREIFPGVKRACDEFLQDKPEEMEPPCNGQAYFKKI